ncbi:histidine kinase [Chloroflexota bacterium]
MKSNKTLALSGKISLLALVALVVGLGLFSWLGIRAVNESIKTTLDERLIVAKTLASQLDQSLKYIIIQMEDNSVFNNDLSADEQFDTAVGSLQMMFEKSGIQVSDLMMIGKNGEVLRTASGNAAVDGLNMYDFPEIQNTLLTGEPRVSALILVSFSETPVVFISTGIIDSDGKVMAALVCTLDIMKANIIPFNQEIRIGQTGYLEIVDNNGLVMARTSPGSPPGVFERSDHPVRFAELITQDKATVGTCHRCHEAEGEIDKERDVLAFAPLQTASWGIAIRQSENEALSPTQQIGRDFLILGLFLLVSTVLLVLGVMQGIVKPIRMLTVAAKKVANNDFSSEVPLQRGDEIGELSAAFSDMRQEIARSRDSMISDFKEAKDKEELRGQLLSSIISAQEEERRRIAREIHDEYGQTLTGLLMNIEALENNLTPEQDGLKHRISHTKSVLSHTLDDMRKLTLDLRPSTLDDLGLVAAVNAHLEMHLGEHQIQVKFNHNDYVEKLDSSLEIAIFRIIQEAVHNVIKHANASRIDIDLVSKDGKIKVNIEDNGQGFDIDTIYASKVGIQSWGILGIKERAELLNGKFSIFSTPGNGTRLEVELPADTIPGSSGES